MQVLTRSYPLQKSVAFAGVKDNARRLKICSLILLNWNKKVAIQKLLNQILKKPELLQQIQARINLACIGAIRSKMGKKAHPGEVLDQTHAIHALGLNKISKRNLPEIAEEMFAAWEQELRHPDSVNHPGLVEHFEGIAAALKKQPDLKNVTAALLDDLILAWEKIIKNRIPQIKPQNN